MKFGFYLPTRGPVATPSALATFAQAGERLGFDSVMIADHVVFPLRIDSPYPYTVGGAFPGHGDQLEQLTLASFVAAKTERLRLVTSVMILPHRNPVLTAKMLATIDFLSNGRLTVGVGVGWMREEFEALDAAPFDDRGAVSNEYLEIFKKLWTEDEPSHNGRFYRFNPLKCQPYPVQKPHPPIWIGGHSRPALRRAAKYGDGWHPVGAVDASPLLPDDFRAKMDELRRLTEAEGRDPSKLDVSLKAPVYDSNAGTRADGGRRYFTGTDEQIADDIRLYQGMGVGEMVFDFRAPTLEACLERMQACAEGVMKRVR
ncbi:MAG: LLM class F420-dependent oxidoreductase [Alphaproteobacteria bacterium]|nr:LLM class F420-dependent oxidoreductase [Alphaproteobacteria bacterium]MCB9930022.1 LLM class F420-dependent oxidoreductase [Alphaproteobacteria bacterium]